MSFSIGNSDPKTFDINGTLQTLQYETIWPRLVLALCAQDTTMAQEQLAELKM